MSNLVKDGEPVTTSGVIALINLHAQLDSLAYSTRLRREYSVERSGRAEVEQQANLIDLLLLRGQILGHIADYERAAQLAEQLVQHAPTEGITFLTRARTYAIFHQFAAALADLDVARQLGADPLVLDAERAAIWQALGHYDEALAFRCAAVNHQPDFVALGALAGLQAERGEVAEAEQLFSEGRRCYQGVSPFPLALLDFQRGCMWLEQGDLDNARRWFDAAVDRLPAYVLALGHRAEVDAAGGEHEAAITRLRSLVTASDDPEYPALLASLLCETGRGQEADQWRTQAATRYAELLDRHPAAFADHAAEFWLAAGGDPDRAHNLAQQNLAIRQTPRAYALLRRTALASSSPLPAHPINSVSG